MVTGGGWKTLADEAVDKKVYRKILADEALKQRSSR